MPSCVVFGLRALSCVEGKIDLTRIRTREARGPVSQQPSTSHLMPSGLDLLDILHLATLHAIRYA